jgi:hypothetical protein
MSIKKRGIWFVVIILIGIFGLMFISENLFFSKLPKYQLSPYPFGMNFAFTITDDPDETRFEKVKPVYDFLERNGFRTTIAVWVLNAKRSNGLPDVDKPLNDGDTLQREDYRDYILWLRGKGFETALHTVSEGNDLREDTIHGYEEYRNMFGEYPKINIMHSNNLENVYWGKKVLSDRNVQWIIYRLSWIYPKVNYPFAGESNGSPYFWGDILKEKTKYVRLWGTEDINTLKFNPSMPYHDPNKQYVNYWFSFSDGYNVKYFNKLIEDANIEKLVSERGSSIVYTHFGAGFTKKSPDGTYILNARFAEQMGKIARKKGGWFVPTSTLLDRLLEMKNVAIFERRKGLVIVNENDHAVLGVTVIVTPGRSTYYGSDGKEYHVNDEKEIIIDRIEPFTNLILHFDDPGISLQGGLPGTFESLRMIVERLKILFLSHSG